MKISNNIALIKSNKNSYQKQNKQKESNRRNNLSTIPTYSYSYSFVPYFGQIKKEQISPEEVKRRTVELEEQDVNPEFIPQIANLPNKQYNRAIELVKKSVKGECIAELTELEDENFKQALFLAEKGIFDFHLQGIASLKGKKYEKALDLLDKGIDSDCIVAFVNLNKSQFKQAEKLLGEGLPPIVAVHFCKLTAEQRIFAMQFLDGETEPDIAAEIALADDKTKEKCLKLYGDGIHPEFVLEIAKFNEEENKRLEELKNLKVDDSSIAEIATLKEEDYRLAVKMLQEGVYDNYINFILEIETGEVENEDYSEYRDRNYSKTTAFSLSLLSNKEIDALTRIRNLHPVIRKLMEEEYEINIADIQNDDKSEAIFTRQIRTPEGTKITLVRTFNEYGEETKSRTEEYLDNSTSSILSNKSGTFKTKYDKHGEIREMTEFIHDIDSGYVTGVIHSKASKLLPGVFESTYYDISQIKEDSISYNTNEPIENCIIGEGEPISKVVQNNDGSITYSEYIQLNDMNTDRTYTEKKDENGNIIYSEYNYQISKENDNKPLMDISRTWRKKDNNNSINTINGVTYNLNFDDTQKEIKISDGENTKIIKTKGKLPYYSEDVLWNEIKKLQVDTILTIFDRVSQWNYCADEDSSVNAYMKTLSTGKNISIIIHESGHLIVNDEPSIIDDDAFIDAYGIEMEIFQTNLPYNEQQYIQYFSPRADLIGSDGADEFVAETNILLTTYGTTNYRIKTRTQFLEKYFPKTIAKVAELTGKNSRESLLK